MRNNRTEDTASKIEEMQKFLSQMPPLSDGMDVPVGSVRDIMVDTTFRATPVRIYSPSSTEKTAAMFYLHGGAFCMSSYRDDEPMARRIVNDAGCTVFSIDYGLAPKYPFPSAIEEAFEVILHVIACADHYGIDPEKIILGGNSAGANIAMALCILADERKAFPVSALSVIYPPLDFTIPHQNKLTGKAAGSMLKNDLIDLCIRDAYLQGDNSQYSHRFLSVGLTADISLFPPVILISAEHCPFTPEHFVFTQRLYQAGIECLHKIYPGVDHGFMDMGTAENLQQDCKRLISAQLAIVLTRGK
ncbi:alpha/beta hydrolase [Brenneria izbisi]|uniref:Alpha/beta hydrolase n=1 Tax=Brenneria izbisi TaxID=2939450 RepID=A0AA41XZ36_9GAMM|nr:alpha/beta hydrolase [Brenneria izbisi]MCV9880294.1 alpha/beta hydrolase [Brenneria izbisi]MCV9883600.1 alpha/beta hydrolase [Brenneria izbisi]